MKTTILAALLTLFYISAYGQDPVTTSPKYYKILLENDQVRVLEYRLKPGEKEPMHSHPAGVVYVLGGAKLKMSSADGKTQESAATSGETFWRSPTTHAIENIGDTEAHAIAIDLKSSASRSTTTSPTKSSSDEEKLWDLERSYWRYVEVNDLGAYANLWHTDFLGWPSVSDAPVRKDHITDWITSQTSKGLIFKAGDLKPAAVHVTGDGAMVYYRITFRWLDKEGNGSTSALRITHSWLKTGNDWRIVGGMSMPEPTTKQSEK